ncbi:MAG TPA: DUF58 domain-containing protein [Oligoflexia bacterium]|mgnify:CR=1 FL=1|nr:DUF58 domain-containing protein [Oligoflexia bacterium]HMP27023.1 DUF58 domain-containing protein [Oligoflexia bacterium]
MYRKINTTLRINLFFNYRSLALYLLAIYLVGTLGFSQKDLLALVFGVLLFSGLFYITITNFICAHLYTKRFKINLVPKYQVALGNYLANRQEELSLEFPKLRLPPTIRLKVSIDFGSDLVEIPDFIISDNPKPDQIITLPIKFPHRGRWQAKKITCEIYDRFLCHRYRWIYNNTSQTVVFNVLPPPVEIRDWQILVSASKSGDELPHPEIADGDYLEIKQYHPNDGARRIIWKLFARRRELLSRHPETAYTPEGEILAILLCDRLQDDLAGAAIGYLRLLEKNQIKINFTASGAAKLSQNSAEALDLMVDTVWQIPDYFKSPQLILTKYKNDIETVNKAIALWKDKKNDAPPEQVLIICGTEELAGERFEQLKKTVFALVQKNIKFTIAICYQANPRKSSANKTKVIADLFFKLGLASRDKKTTFKKNNTIQPSQIAVQIESLRRNNLSFFIGEYFVN